MAGAFSTLTQQAQFLRNSAPREFDQFRMAFGGYTLEVIQKLLSAAENLPQAQGQAQQCSKIFDMLKDIK